jgi:hypothetical protein
MPILSIGTAIDIREQEFHAWYDCNSPVALTSSIVPTRYDQIFRNGSVTCMSMEAPYIVFFRVEETISV